MHIRREECHGRLDFLARLITPDQFWTTHAGTTFLPDAYRLPEGAVKGSTSPISTQVVYIEVTNRCNLLCETCPRTFFNREPLKTLTYDEFVQIAEQFPTMRRASLHGIGEPLLNKELPQIIEYLKHRDIEVIINSNGTLLTPTWQEALVEWKVAGPKQSRVSSCYRSAGSAFA